MANRQDYALFKSLDFRITDTFRRIATTFWKASEVAIFDGPVLLAEKIPAPTDQKTVLVDESNELLHSIKPTGDAPTAFETMGLGKPKDFELAPFYDAWHEHYAVYSDQFTPAQWKQSEADYEAQQARQRELRARTVDMLAIGEMQPERDHNLTGENTRVGDHLGKKWRDATGDGWFEFTMTVDPKTDNQLVVTYWGGESPRRTFELLVDGKPLARQLLDNDHPGQFFDVTYPLPRAVTSDGKDVHIRFVPVDHSMVGGCFGARVVRVVRKSS